MSNLIICLVFILIATILIWSVVSAHFKISGLEANMTELQTNILYLERRMGLERIGTAKVGTCIRLEVCLDMKNFLESVYIGV